MNNEQYRGWSVWQSPNGAWLAAHWAVSEMPITRATKADITAAIDAWHGEHKEREA